MSGGGGCSRGGGSVSGPFLEHCVPSPGAYGLVGARHQLAWENVAPRGDVLGVATMVTVIPD